MNTKPVYGSVLFGKNPQAEAGNLRSNTMRAFTADEMLRIVAPIPWRSIAPAPEGKSWARHFWHLESVAGG